MDQRSIEDLFERNADMRLLELRHNEPGKGAPPNRRVASFGAESITTGMPDLEIEQGPQLRVGIAAAPSSGVIPGAVIGVAIDVYNDGDEPAPESKLQLSLPLESEFRAGTLRIDGREPQAPQALFSHGLPIPRVLGKSSAKVTFQLAILAGINVLYLQPRLTAEGVPIVGTAGISIKRGATGGAIAEPPRPFYELEPDEIAEVARETAEPILPPILHEPPAPPAPAAPTAPAVIPSEVEGQPQGAVVEHIVLPEPSEASAAPAAATPSAEAVPLVAATPAAVAPPAAVVPPAAVALPAALAPPAAVAPPPPASLPAAVAASATAATAAPPGAVAPSRGAVSPPAAAAPPPTAAPPQTATVVPTDPVAADAEPQAGQPTADSPRDTAAESPPGSAADPAESHARSRLDADPEAATEFGAGTPETVPAQLPQPAAAAETPLALEPAAPLALEPAAPLALEPAAPLALEPAAPPAIAGSEPSSASQGAEPTPIETSEHPAPARLPEPPPAIVTGDVAATALADPPPLLQPPTADAGVQPIVLPEAGEPDVAVETTAKGKSKAAKRARKALAAAESEAANASSAPPATTQPAEAAADRPAPEAIGSAAAQAEAPLVEPLAASASPPAPAASPAPAPTPEPKMTRFRTLGNSDLALLERLFGADAPGQIAHSVLISSVACCEPATGRDGSGYSAFLRRDIESLGRALVHSRMGKPSQYRIAQSDLDALALPWEASPPQSTPPSRRLRRDLRRTEWVAIGGLMQPSERDATLRTRIVLLMQAAATVEGVDDRVAEECATALAAYRSAALAWLVPLCVASAGNPAFVIPLPPAGVDAAGRKLVAALKPALTA